MRVGNSLSSPNIYTKCYCGVMCVCEMLCMSKDCVLVTVGSILRNLASVRLSGNISEQTAEWGEKKRSREKRG